MVLVDMFLLGFKGFSDIFGIKNEQTLVVVGQARWV